MHEPRRSPRGFFRRSSRSADLMCRLWQSRSARFWVRGIDGMYISVASAVVDFCSGLVGSFLHVVRPMTRMSIERRLSCSAPCVVRALERASARITRLWRNSPSMSCRLPQPFLPVLGQLLAVQTKKISQCVLHSCRLLFARCIGNNRVGRVGVL